MAAAIKSSICSLNERKINRANKTRGIVVEKLFAWNSVYLWNYDAGSLILALSRAHLNFFDLRRRETRRIVGKSEKFIMIVVYQAPLLRHIIIFSMLS